MESLSFLRTRPKMSQRTEQNTEKDNVLYLFHALKPHNSIVLSLQFFLSFSGCSFVLRATFSKHQAFGGRSEKIDFCHILHINGYW